MERIVGAWDGNSGKYDQEKRRNVINKEQGPQGLQAIEKIVEEL